MTEVQNKESVDNKKKTKKKISKVTEASTQTEIKQSNLPIWLSPYENLLKSLSKNLKTWIFFAFSIGIIARKNFLREL